MKLALISDIHANLEALEAVLRDITTQKVDVIHCLGDVIGYGSDPLPCLELVKKHCDVMLMGMFLLQKKHELLIQVFQPQQRANTLVERVFVDNQNESL